MTEPFRIVLYQPEIPANTGNIGRLCVGTNTQLHIIKPMRFLITDKQVKRAGLDYWDKLDIHIHNSFEDFLAEFSDKTIYFCTTKSQKYYSDRVFKSGDCFVFGPESRGIPEDILRQYVDQTITIPMSGEIRSLNLANSAAIVLYEALRQTGYRGEPHPGL
ncbi:MAG: tRNA (cytidine(34)-2'-O)-methyltransferase [Candidatus Cloacimonetes bacterium]|nr:tRNA (cytidine(34)-2'-O)-methyltransferase [Candidatus Cloacimonadota bacterium]